MLTSANVVSGQLTPRPIPVFIVPNRFNRVERTHPASIIESIEFRGLPDLFLGAPTIALITHLRHISFNSPGDAFKLHTWPVCYRDRAERDAWPVTRGLEYRLGCFGSWLRLQRRGRPGRAAIFYDFEDKALGESSYSHDNVMIPEKIFAAFLFDRPNRVGKELLIWDPEGEQHFRAFEGDAADFKPSQRQVSLINFLTGYAAMTLCRVWYGGSINEFGLHWSQLSAVVEAVRCMADWSRESWYDENFLKRRGYHLLQSREVENPVSTS